MRVSTIIKIIAGLLGGFGLGSLVFIIWRCMLKGGDDWELLINFNKKGEGRFEITMITLFLVLYVISMGYIVVESETKKKARLNAKDVYKQLEKESQRKYKPLFIKLSNKEKR